MVEKLVSSPQLNFVVADTQKWLIELSNKNMLESLRDAVVFTLLVIFLFLANVRMLIVSFFSVPITYTITIGLMWLFGFNFNIVTLTAVILALGMLTDDAVVVLENIERHYFELKKDIWRATIDGTKEVMLAVLSGPTQLLQCSFPSFLSAVTFSTSSAPSL